jgi:uncharacterized protein YndB with AHSA1/START domain
MSDSAVVAKAEMLIRKPVAVVFEAFVDPKYTTQFWFTKSSGRLDEGKQVTWEWEMYGATANVHVKAIEKNKHILIVWGAEGTKGIQPVFNILTCYVGAMTDVEWFFTPYQGDSATFVQVKNSGFKGDNLIAQVVNSTGGFTYLLAGAKAFLEHNLKLNLVADHSPAGVQRQPL